MLITNTYFTTFTAPLRRVSRVDVDNRNASFVGFVLDKLLQFVERPGMDRRSKLTRCFNPVSNVSQFFENDHVSGLAVGDNGFTDTMVLVPHVATFFAREPSQSAFSTFRAFALKSLAKLRVMFSDVHDLFARKRLSVGGGGEVIESAVNPNGITARGNGNLFTQTDVDIKDFFVSVVGQCCGRRLLSFKESALEIANGKFDVLAFRVSSNTDLFFDFDKSEGMNVEIHRSWFELLRWPFALKSGSNPRYCSNNQIRLKLILILEIIIAEVLKLYFVCSLVLFRDRTNVITALSEAI